MPTYAISVGSGGFGECGEFQIRYLHLGIRSRLFRDPVCKLGDPLELCNAISFLVIAHHDSYKYAFITFPFQHLWLLFFFC